jgi:thiol-disulfide isomerase/thioredoxin
MNSLVKLSLLLICSAFTMQTKDVKPLPIINLDSYKQLITETKNTNQTLLISFWASWCKPCIEEMPYLISAVDSLNTEALFLSIDDVEMSENVSKFIYSKKWNANFKLLDLTDFDAFINFTNPSWQGEIPMTILIHKNKTFSHLSKFNSTLEVIQFIKNNTN